MSIFKLIVGFSMLLLALVTILYGLNFKRSKGWIRLFFIYLVFLLLGDIVSKSLWFFNQNNLLVSQLFNFIELVLISFFYLNFTADKKSNLILPSALIVAIVMLSSSFFLYSLNEFNVIGFFALKFFVIAFSLREIYLYKFEKRNRCYWVNLGLLISSAVNVAILSFGNILAQYSFEFQNGIWTFNAIIFIVALAFYGIEIMNERKWKLTN